MKLLFLILFVGGSVTLIQCQQDDVFVSPIGNGLLRRRADRFGPNIPCGGNGHRKRHRIRNPSTLPTECSYTIRPLNQHVCQVRIDFDMVLEGPKIPKTTNAGQYPKCEEDVFSAEGIHLCGINQNQHSMSFVRHFPVSVSF